MEIIHGNPWKFSRSFRRISRPPTPWSSSVATSSLASSPRAGSPRWRWRPYSSACGTSRRPGTMWGGDGMGLGGFHMGKPWENPWEIPWHQKAIFVGERGKSKFGKECFAWKIWDDRKTWCRKRCLSFGVGMQNGNFWVDLDWGYCKLFGDDFSTCEVGQWREQSPCTTKICAFGSEPWLKSCISSSMAAPVSAPWRTWRTWRSKLSRSGAWRFLEMTWNHQPPQ